MGEGGIGLREVLWVKIDNHVKCGNADTSRGDKAQDGRDQQPAWGVWWDVQGGWGVRGVG